jgi:hypothetical protein
MLNNLRDLRGCCGPPRFLPLGFIYCPQLLLLLVSIHQSQDQTPSPERKREPRAGSVRQRRFCPRLRLEGPRRVWELLCVAWKVLVARGGRIDHWGSRNFSPNIGLLRARRAECSVALITVRMPLPSSLYPSPRVDPTNRDLGALERGARRARQCPPPGGTAPSCFATGGKKTGARPWIYVSTVGIRSQGALLVPLISG